MAHRRHDLKAEGLLEDAEAIAELDRGDSLAAPQGVAKVDAIINRGRKPSMEPPLTRQRSRAADPPARGGATTYECANPK